MAGNKKVMGNTVISGFCLLAALACPMLLAQTQDAKPVSKAAAEFIAQLCDSWESPVRGESIADAGRRLAVWRECKQWADSKGVRLHESLWPHESQMMKTELTPSPGTHQTPTDGNRQDARIEEIIARCTHLFNVYQGQIFIGVKPVLGYHSYTQGLGPISQLEATVGNDSPDSHTVNVRVSCGSWSQAQSFSIPANRRYEGFNAPVGQPPLIFTPPSDCTLETLRLDTWRRDIR
jgi:hypothetical protein